MQEWWRGFGELYLKGQEIERLDSLAESEAEAAWKLAGADPGARIVDAPCGFGRHAVRLGAWGFDVWGIDVDDMLLDEAKKRSHESGLAIRLDRGDLRDLPVPSDWADAVMNLSSSIGLFASNDDNQAIFDEARRVLRDGGAFLIETTHRDREVRRSGRKSWELRNEGMLAVTSREFDLVDGRLDFTVTMIAEDGARTHLRQRPRVYAIPELIRALRRAGFADVECFGGWQGEKPSVDERIVVVAH